MIALRTEMHGLPVRLAPVERDRLQAAHDSLETAGLRPSVDELACVVRADCPCCHAGRTDPLGLWRALTVVCGRDELRPRLLCAAGCPEGPVRAVLQDDGSQARVAA